MYDIVKRASAGAVLGGALLFTGGMGLAGAAPVTNVQDGLVNLGVGNVNVLRDVDVNVAAQVAALICGVSVGDIGVLAEQVDLGNQPSTTCQSNQGPITISQNGPANSPNAANAPGQQRG
jgi:hypothetical protein